MVYIVLGALGDRVVVEGVFGSWGAADEAIAVYRQQWNQPKANFLIVERMLNQVFNAAAKRQEVLDVIFHEATKRR